MAKNSQIEWCDHTFNPWIGCTKVSPGCLNCYAETLMDHRYRHVKWGKGEPRKLTKTWKQPIQWNREARLDGPRPKVFCASLADVFDAEVPQEWRKDLWTLIEQTPRLDWLLLTKRIENVSKMTHWEVWPKHVWLGVTIENANVAKERLPILATIPAAIKFVSAEPLLSDFDFGDTPIDWLIAGGESGQNFRPVNIDHIRSLRDQCQNRGVAFFFKQWGGRNPKAAGAILDGREWKEFPVNRQFVIGA